ncbi:MAG: oligosaccharide flippase family protein [Verrucomicrobia bacterium]|nr:oligosaccharide flippase family protein [Verrucomicrobiota bacterium]MDA1086881.1 oligosaccharide flippase family protein [Verrucomicrobiota bacterium]
MENLGLCKDSVFSFRPHHATNFNGMRSRFLRDITVFSAGSLVVGMLYMLYAILTARLLGDAEYGLFQALMGLHGMAMTLGLVLNVGTLHVVSTAQDTHKAQALGAAMRVALFFGVILCGALALASPIASRFLGADSVFPFVALGLMVFTNIILETLYGGLQGRNQYGVFSMARAIDAIMTMGLGVLLIVSGFSAAGAVGGYAISMGIVCMALLRRRGLYEPNAGIEPVRKEMRGLRQPLAVALALMVVSNVPMLVARARLPEAMAGHYGVLFGLRFGVLTFAMAAAWPLYSRSVSGDGEPGMLRKALATVAVPGIGLLGVSVVAPRLFIGILFGEGYLPAADHLSGYAVYLLAHGLCMVLMFHRAASGSLRGWTLVPPVSVVLSLAWWPALGIATIIAAQTGAWVLWIAVDTGCRTIGTSLGKSREEAEGSSTR